MLTNPFIFIDILTQNLYADIHELKPISDINVRDHTDVTGQTCTTSGFNLHVFSEGQSLSISYFKFFWYAITRNGCHLSDYLTHVFCSWKMYTGDSVSQQRYSHNKLHKSVMFHTKFCNSNENRQIKHPTGETTKINVNNLLQINYLSLKHNDIRKFKKLKSPWVLN